jgi:FAD/FMN-containing dehydrogenase
MKTGTTHQAWRGSFPRHAVLEFAMTSSKVSVGQQNTGAGKTPMLKRRDGTVLDGANVQTFMDAFGGTALAPGNAGYDAARRLWNASIDKYPGLIAQCSSTADVVHAVKFARSHNLIASIKGGGHNVAGRALCDNGIVIDLSPMKRISVDPLLRTVQVQAGALLGDVDRETHAYGLAIPAGVMSKTGIAGLTLGGGVGWLVRKYGLTCDNLLGCEVVTAEGKIVTADTVTNPDLFWGLRGGGGNFGIVTSFRFQAHPVSTVLGGVVLYPRDQAASVFRFYRDFMESAPEELTVYAGLISTPEGMPAVALMACYCGNPTEGERVMQPLRTIATPVFEAIQVMPFPVMQKFADESNPDGIHNYWRSTFLQELSDEVIDLVIAHGEKAGSPLSQVLVQIFNGAVRKIDDAATAFAHRRAGFHIGIEAKWTDPEESPKHIAWSHAFWDALGPYSIHGSLVNFLGEEGMEGTRAAFGSNYERLVELKSKYDPTNFFSLNVNVKPRA